MLQISILVRQKYVRIIVKSTRVVIIFNLFYLIILKPKINLKYYKIIQADYIFLSPPWGGVEYKESEFYSIKQTITPNIYDIIRTCLSHAKNIIFYLPRTIKLDEFFEIIDNSVINNKENSLFIDIHILNSANKIKAILLIFGHSANEVQYN